MPLVEQVHVLVVNEHVYALVQHAHACTWACGYFQLSMHTFSLARTLQLTMWLLVFEHAHTWPCLRLHLSLCTLAFEHVHTFSWACAHFHLSMRMPSVEHAHAFSWACVHLYFSMCMLQFSMWMLSLEHVHAFTWACAPFYLRMCMLSLENVYAFTWAYTLLCSIGCSHADITVILNVCTCSTLLHILNIALLRIFVSHVRTQPHVVGCSSMLSCWTSTLHYMCIYT